MFVRRSQIRTLVQLRPREQGLWQSIPSVVRLSSSRSVLHDEVAQLLRDAKLEPWPRAPGPDDPPPPPPWTHPALELATLHGRGKGWVLKEPLPAGTLVLREQYLAATLTDQALPAAVLTAVAGTAVSPSRRAAVQQAAAEFALLSPPRRPSGNASNKNVNTATATTTNSTNSSNGVDKDEAYEEALEHALEVCRVNASCRVNVDDFLPLSHMTLGNALGAPTGDPLCLWWEGGRGHSDQSHNSDHISGQMKSSGSSSALENSNRSSDGSRNLNENESSGNRMSSSATASPQFTAAQAASALSPSSYVHVPRGHGTRSPGGACLPARRSLLNHSCRANTSTLHLPGGVYVRTLDDLRAGDELTAEYLAGLSLLQPTSERQSMLRNTWGFTCSCPRCSPPVILGGGGSHNHTGNIHNYSYSPTNGGHSSLQHSRSLRSSSSGGSSGSFSSSLQASSDSDPLDLPPTRGWLMTLNDAMNGVARGASGADQVLQWLASRQRKHAGQLPSYAEMGCWSAISCLKVSNAVVSAQGLTGPSSSSQPSLSSSSSNPLTSEESVQSNEANSATAAANSVTNYDDATATRAGAGATATAGGNATTTDAWIAQAPQRKELATAVLASRQALAESLPVWNTVNLSPNHPGRVPPLLASALVAWTTARTAHEHGKEEEEEVDLVHASDDSGTDGKPEDTARALQEVAWGHMREALRVHQVAYGGGVELFLLRYPSSELNEILEHGMEQGDMVDC